MDEILNELKKFRDERNWGKFHTPRNLATSVSIEAAEVLEHFQWEIGEGDEGQLDREALGSELADVLIYLLMLFDSLGLDPTKEAMQKIRMNNDRFPIGSQPGKKRQ